MDGVDGGSSIAVRFQMEGNHVGACFDKVVDIAQRFADHQMNIKHTVKILADTFHDRRTKGDVGDKMSVHDVDMQPWCTCLLHLLCLLAQLGKIRRKNGRRNLYHKGHDLS